MLEFQSLPYWSKIKDSVTFTGFINFGEALLDLYDAHDLYILPSYHEGFPHSIWEAAALSTPVITTAVGGIPGVLSSDDVWFIPVKDAGAIANTVKIILQSPEMRKSKVESLYKKLLNNTLEAGTNKLKLAIQEN
jgi:glycosyltransferase involved in cell wall biosynthesis